MNKQLVFQAGIEYSAGKTITQFIQYQLDNYSEFSDYVDLDNKKYPLAILYALHHKPNEYIIRVNNQRIKKDYILHAGDCIQIWLP